MNAASVSDMLDSCLYRKPFCEVALTTDIVYGRVRGYWTSMDGVGQNMKKAVSKGLARTLAKRDLDLTLDLYQPEGVQGKRPLVMFLHGGAFYFGSKQEEAYVDMCRYFASMGYVAASINYRLGFHISKKDMERAAFDALEDSWKALRYLVSNSEEYGIDTDRIFLCGSSSGAITALNMAFMGEEQDIHIAAVANLWGAVLDLDMLEGKNTGIVSFHGDCDCTVPYDEGYTLTKPGKEHSPGAFSTRMSGSACIDRKAGQIGIRHQLYTFPGEGHALNKDKRGALNGNHAFIKEKIAEFFYEDAVK